MSLHDLIGDILDIVDRPAAVAGQDDRGPAAGRAVDFIEHLAVVHLSDDEALPLRRQLEDPVFGKRPDDDEPEHSDLDPLLSGQGDGLNGDA